MYVDEEEGEGGEQHGEGGEVVAGLGPGQGGEVGGEGRAHQGRDGLARLGRKRS